MHHNIAVIDYQPAGIGLPFDVAFPFMLNERLLDDTISQGIQHTIAGGSTDDEVIGERNEFFNIQQEDIFAFLVFQGIDNCVCKFKCIQKSPLIFIVGANLALFGEDMVARGREQF